MKNILQSIIVAFAMYSKIPVPRIEWNKENMKYAMCFFPLVGAVIGLVILGAAYLLMWVWPKFSVLFVTGVFVLIPVVISGGIHLDGLLDTADALSSYQPMERRLEILKDSNSGAFAIIVGISYFIADFCIWHEVRFAEIGVLALSFILSRALSGLSVVTFKCARNSGLAKTFADGAQKKTVRNVMIIIIAVVVAAMLIVNPALGAIAAVGAGLAFAIYHHVSYKNFGGITGDLAGFFLQICELMMALFVVVGSRIIY